jgi:hypothetical protein
MWWTELVLFVYLKLDPFYNHLWNLVAVDGRTSTLVAVDGSTSMLAAVDGTTSMLYFVTDRHKKYALHPTAPNWIHQIRGAWEKVLSTQTVIQVFVSLTWFMSN